MTSPVAEYQRAADQNRRDQLVIDHLDLVHHVLGRIIGGLPSGIDVENLKSAGVLGLVEAAAKFDPTRGVAFATFATVRVRGAIFDELRRNSVFPQQVLERIAAIRAARRVVAAPATIGDLARAANLSEDEVADTLAAMRLTRMLSWEEAGEVANRERSPEENVADRERTELLARAIESLPERERLLVTMYYRDELRLKEMSEVIGLSESRVSRVLNSALLQLREYLMVHGEGSTLPCPLQMDLD